LAGSSSLLLCLPLSLRITTTVLRRPRRPRRLSKGVTSQDNQLQFVKDTFTGAAKYNVQGVMYFSQNPFVLISTALKAF
jgi:hypothetical protein